MAEPQNADSVVVELIARNAQFDAAAKASAAKFDQSMGQIASSATKAEAAVGRSASANVSAIQRESAQISQFSKILARDMEIAGSSMLSSSSPFVIPVKQGPVVSSAIRSVGSSVLVLGGILETVTGVGIALFIASLIEMVTKSHDASGGVDDLVEKLKEHHDKALLSEEAQRIYNRTIEGSIEAMAKLTAEIDKQNLTLEDNIALKKAAIAGALSDVSVNLGGVVTQLAQAATEYRAAKDALEHIQSGNLPLGENAGAVITAAQSRVDAARQKIADLRVQMNALTKATEEGARALRSVDFPLLERSAKEAVDPIAAINRKYDDMATKAERAAQGNDRLKASLKGTLTEIERSRAADLAAARASNRSSGYSGKQIDFGEAASIAERAGLQVNSAQRSYADQKRLWDAWVAQGRPKDNPVAAPGTSAHEGAKGRWALDIQLEPGVTASKIKKIYGDEGVAVNVFPERGHLHVSGSRSQAASAESEAARAAEKAQRQAEAAAQKKAEQEAAFQVEMDRLSADLIASRGSQVKDQLEQADLAEEAVRAEQKRRDDTYAAAAVSHRLTQAQADQLVAVNATLAAEKIKAIEAQKGVERLRREDEAAERAAQYRIDDLRAAEQDATSQAQRREIDLQILDILYQEKEAHLQRLKLIAENNHDQARANDLQAQIDRLPAEKANDVQGTLRGTMDPLESWLRSVPHDAAAVEEALQGIAVNGFDTIASSIAGVVTGTETLGQAFGNLAKQVVNDVVQMTVRMLIFRALSSVIGGSGLGQSIFPVTNGVDPLAPLPGRATGGPVSAGQAYKVGEHGTELFVPGASGTIIPNNALAASSWAGGQSVIVLHVEANDYFDARVAQVSGPIAAQAGTRGAYAGAGIARNGLARRQLHQLGSRG